MADERIWLDVPFEEKEEAKALGASWDPNARRWYAPSLSEGLARWAALPEIPDLLPGEDRSFGSGLFIDMVPSSCWFTNVRSCVSPRDWERLRRMITRRAGRRCEACGATEDRERLRWLEAHERWEYNEQTNVQTLRRLVCLCTDCHTTTHFGLAQIRGKDKVALAHLREVTKMTEEEANAHVEQAFAVWKARSEKEWTLDLRVLTSAGVTLASPPEPSRRASIAKEKLANE